MIVKVLIGGFPSGLVEFLDRVEPRRQLIEARPRAHATGVPQNRSAVGRCVVALCRPVVGDAANLPLVQVELRGQPSYQRRIDGRRRAEPHGLLFR